MEGKPSVGLRSTFLVHMIIAAIVGDLLLFFPGRILWLAGWVPNQVEIDSTGYYWPGMSFVDPVITRILGAALLTLVFVSYLGWRAQKWADVVSLVRIELVFCILGAVGLLAGIRGRTVPLIIWGTLVILVVFAAAWGLALLRPPKTKA